MKKRKKFTAMVLAMVMAASLAGPALSASASGVFIDGNTEYVPAVESDHPADKVIVAVDDDSFNVGPWGTDSSVRTYTEMQLWTALCYRPFIGALLENGELEMKAATSVEKIDDTTYEVSLYEGITDIYGNELKASDVVWSYDTLTELAFVSYISTYYDYGEVIDDYTLRLHLTTTADGAIEEVLCDCNLCCQDWYENATEDEIETEPACTGSYYVGEVSTGASVTMIARDDYWKSEDRTTTEIQNVKEIEIRCIPEDSMRSIALENNEVDMAEISTSEVARFDDNDEYNVTRFVDAMSTYLIFNTSENSVCQDENVRLALAYGFDAMTMLQGNGHSEGTVLHDVAINLAPDYVDAWDDEDYFERDIDKAKEYLAAAGYEEGELTVRLMVSSQAPQGPFQAFQAMELECGINVEILSYDRALRNQYIYDNTQWDICEDSASLRDFTTTVWDRLFSDDNYEYGTRGFTIDPTLQELLRAADADRSEENMNAFHYYVMDHAYMVGAYNETKAIVTKSGITDICMQKLDSVLNAMTFTDDYQSVG